MLEFDARDAAAAAAAAAAWETETETGTETGTETEMEGTSGATRMTVRKEEEDECVLAAVLSSWTSGRVVWYW